MKVGLFFDCGQPLLEISVHSFLSRRILCMVKATINDSGTELTFKSAPIKQLF